MAKRPQHHVMPDEFRKWFEKRGFTGATSMDPFCVEQDPDEFHGLGWKMSEGRSWEGNWKARL